MRKPFHNVHIEHRPGSVRQLVHHVADSHMNAYIRFKWTLSEDNPTIKAYDQDRWATLADSQQTPVDVWRHGLRVETPAEFLESLKARGG